MEWINRATGGMSGEGVSRKCVEDGEQDGHTSVVSRGGGAGNDDVFYLFLEKQIRI